MIDVNGPVSTIEHAGLTRGMAWRACGSMRHTRDVPGVAGKPVSSPAKTEPSGPGDAYYNALAEAWVATFKSELVDGRRLSSFEHAEHELLRWIGFYNDERLHEELGDLPPSSRS